MSDSGFPGFRRRLVVVALLGGLVVVIALNFGWLALMRFQKAQASWAEYNERSIAISLVVLEINRHIGFGGLIHNFKNLVLRRDLALYQEAIERDLREVTGDMDQLDSLLTTPESKAAANQLRATLIAYADKYERIAPMIAAGKSSAEIDAVVRVNDTLTVAALATLTAHINQRTLDAEKTARKALDEAMLFLRFGGLLVVAAILTSIATVLVYMRRLMVAHKELAEAKQRADLALKRQQDMQDELVQAEKMAALGGLVAGMAHEINTPIGISLGAVTHLESETRKADALYRAGELTEDGLNDFFATASQAARLMAVNSQRASDLIASFKQVAVDQTGGEQRTFNLAEYIDEVLLSLRPLLKKSHVDVHVVCPADVVVTGFPGALSQVLANLVMNALVHAFEPGQTGRIDVLAQRVDAQWIELVVRDNGKGIPVELHAKVFDPFFTTRRGMGGSGLGLHIVFNIVYQTLKGTLKLDSLVGQGTAFTLRFPSELHELRQ